MFVTSSSIILSTLELLIRFIYLEIMVSIFVVAGHVSCSFLAGLADLAGLHEFMSII